MIANLLTVSRTKLLHACLTLTCTTIIYLCISRVIFQTFLIFPFPSEVFSCSFFFPLLSFLISRPLLYDRFCFCELFFLCWLQIQWCSFWCLQFKCFSPAPDRSPGHPLCPPLPLPLGVNLLMVGSIYFFFPLSLVFWICSTVLSLFVPLGAKQLPKSAFNRVIIYLCH